MTIQVMHQKLEDSQLELAEVRQHYEEALDEIDEWRSRGGLPKINEVEDIPHLTPCKRCYLDVAVVTPCLRSRKSPFVIKVSSKS